MAAEYNVVQGVTAPCTTRPVGSGSKSTISIVAQNGRGENPWISRLHAVCIRLLLHKGNVKAFVSVGIGKPDNPTLIIHGCKVIQQPNRRAYVRLPDQKGNDGRWRPVVEALDPQFEEALSAVVLAAFQEVLHGHA